MRKHNVSYNKPSDSKVIPHRSFRNVAYSYVAYRNVASSYRGAAAKVEVVVCTPGLISSVQAWSERVNSMILLFEIGCVFFSDMWDF